MEPQSLNTLSRTVPVSNFVHSSQKSSKYGKIPFSTLCKAWVKLNRILRNLKLLFGAAFSQTYDAVGRTYAAFSQTYAAFSQTYAAVGRTYAAFSQTYAAFSQTYAAVGRKYAVIQTNQYTKILQQVSTQTQPISRN